MHYVHIRKYQYRKSTELLAPMDLDSNFVSVGRSASWPQFLLC